MEIHIGRVRKLQGGYGFIECDDGADRLFLASALRPLGTLWHTVTVGQRVSYTPVTTEKGLRAENVRIVDKPEETP